MLTVSRDVRERFKDLDIKYKVIKDVNVKPYNEDLEDLKREVIQEVMETYSLETLKDRETFKAYRRFFWMIGIDPTKIRPAAEALIRRILRGKGIPRINTLVDAYNLASIKTEIALAAFDLGRLEETLTLRFGRGGEEFRGIGMKEPMRLKGGEVVISSGEKVIAVYPYRDSEETKITSKTREVMIVACGVPGINMFRLENAIQLSCRFILRFCGGHVVR